MNDQQVPGREKAQQRRLQRLVAAARAALAWENIWRAAAPVLTVVGFFLAVSWMGAWQVLPHWARIAGLAVFALAILFLLWREARLRWPSRTEALARLDHDSGVLHRPASALEDTLANRSSDPTTQALWAVHRKRLEAEIAGLKVAAPSPRVPQRDRYALRAAALVLVVATAIIAGPERYARVAAAFDWRIAAPSAPGVRIDAWIDPPAYTGKPPVILQIRRTAEAQARAGGLLAPVGSTVVIRASDPGALAIEMQGALEPAEKPSESKPSGAASRQVAGETRLALKGDAHLVMRQSDNVLAAFDITAIPDRPPTIELKDQPKPNVRGTLSLAYKIDDDYGVIGAEAKFDNPILRDKPVTGRHLVDPPRVGLALPSGPGGLGDATTTADLSENAWAGARVTMTLHARDEGNNEGTSDPIEILLPQRPFVKPLARALVEQRRNLALAPDERARVENSLEALAMAPDKFGTNAGVYLGLHSALYRLKRARTDPELLAVADYLWEMALRIEDGDLSDAERDLRAAQQQLREALQRGASDEEIKKLTENLRAALDKFLQELAERQMREQGDRQQADRNAPRNNRTVTPQDLKSMLDRLEDMAKNGSMAEAQRMLDQLQNILENLQTAKRRNQQNSASREMSKALDELDKLTREQQELRDQTFRKGQRERQSMRERQQGRDPSGRQQRQRGPGQRPQAGEQGDQDQNAQGEGEEQDAQGAPSEEELQQRQQQLSERLAELQKRMKQLGHSGESGLDDAEDAMKDAQEQLGKGQSGRGQAVDSQGRALEALRRGAQQLAQRMQQQGEGEGSEEAEDDGGETPDGMPRQANRDNRADPLGRPMANDPYNPRSRYDPLGAPPAQRAQRVLEELRRRIGDPSRPQEELDYLDRLLRRF
ncbi:MAG TPA: TIGR02302 family protein [Beijerinckiaceae bacterium]|nr:TIGR02302 family protein [Beijerinckiaceae bacterium]